MEKRLKVFDSERKKESMYEEVGCRSVPILPVLWLLLLLLSEWIGIANQKLFVFQSS